MERRSWAKLVIVFDTFTSSQLCLNDHPRFGVIIIHQEMVRHWIWEKVGGSIRKGQGSLHVLVQVTIGISLSYWQMYHDNDVQISFDNIR